MQSGKLWHKYNKMLLKGKFKKDTEQEKIVAALINLEQHVIDKNKKSWLSILKPKDESQKKNKLYIHGTVGRGKTILMKLFYDSLATKSKKFFHYHLFMRGIHKNLFEVRKNKKTNLNPVTIVAKNNLENVEVLCLDEFFINDIADATIMYKLFQFIFDSEITIVLTSNTPPRELYKKGINRHFILPFIELIEEKMEVISLDGDFDWRKSNQILDKIYNLKENLDSENNTANDRFSAIWQNFLGNSKPMPQTVLVHNRKIIFNRTKKRVLRTSFTRLCFSEYAAADYLAICEKFDVVMIEGLHPINSEANDIVTRLIIMTDIFYNAGIVIIILADVDIDGIYQASWSDSGFQRMLSRLHAMRTADYLHNSARDSIAKNSLIKFLEN